MSRTLCVTIGPRFGFRFVFCSMSLELFAVVLCASACGAAPADWHQFRGPDRTGVSTEKGLLKKWPEDGPPVAWKATGLGEGFSSVSVAGDHVYSMGDREDACYLIAINRKTGEEAWSTKVGKTGGNYKGPRSTPTVDGQRVYALGQFGDLLCCDVKTGEVVWKKNLVGDLKAHLAAGTIRRAY
jgi:outer membrane protein assembly factor BamB